MRTLLLVLAAAAAPAAAQEPTPEEAARAAALEWLAVVDGGRYAESWSRAAEAFRAALTQAAWDSTMRVHRAPLGAVRSRESLGAQRVTDPPGAPPGEYVLLQFRTAFAGREQPSVETVVPMKGADGVWRVSGYFIR